MIYKKIILVAFAFLLIPLSSSAHEQRVVDLKGTLYLLVIGSLGEPILVDDKTGLDMSVRKIGSRKLFEAQVTAGNIPKLAKPIPGLEETLEAEIYTTNNVMPMELTAVWGEVGKYKTLFFPTSQTKLGYRIFGTIEGFSLDERFICSEKGHVMKDMGSMESAAMHASEKETASPVTMYKTGSFGCPKGKNEYGFPSKARKDGARDYSDLFALGMSALALAFTARMYFGKKSHR